MPTTPVKILGFSYELPQSYSAGHVCSASEAAALNKVLVRGLSKGLYKVLAGALRPTGFTSAEGLGADTVAAIQEMGTEFINDHCMGFSAGHDVQRSIKVEADRIARQMLETQLYRKGQNLKDLTEADRAAQLAQIAQSERVRAEAERRVHVTQEIAERAHGELLENLGGEN